MGADIAERVAGDGSSTTRRLESGDSGSTTFDGAAAEPAGPPRIAGFELRERVGSGGFGAVYRAIETGFGREVAIKVIHPKRAGGGGDRRFLAEAVIAGKLQHPNILPVHALGQDETGRSYFTMKLTSGRTLESILDGLAAGAPADAAEYTVPRLLPVFLDVCDAVAYAHSQGVVHRDLKPGNIMTGDFGQVYVLDWGLAKSRAAAPEDGDGRAEENRQNGDTLSGTVLGTPGYMPPEQAAGRVDLVGEKSDIYALGAILYEILALRLPVGGEDSRGLIEHTIAGAVIPPRRAAPGRDIPPELAAIALKALSPRPEDRYASAEELAADVRRYLEDREVSVCRYGLPDRALKWARRNRGLAGALAAGTLAGTLATLVALAALLHAAGLKAEGEEQARRATAELLAAERAEKDRLARQGQAWQHFLRGVNLARARSHTEAETEFREALKQDPTFIRAYRELAFLHIAMLQPDAAKADLIEENRATRDATGRDSAEALCLLGQMYLDSYGDRERARQCFLSAAEVGGDDPQSLLGRMNALALDGDYAAAAGAAREAARRYPAMYEAQFLLGQFLLQAVGETPQAGQAPELREAFAAFGKALELNPESLESAIGGGEAMSALAEVAGESDLAAQAEETLRRLARANTDSIPAQRALLKALCRAEKWHECLREALAQSAALPSAPEPHYYAARALRALGNNGEAQTEIESALRLSPDNRDYRALQTELAPPSRASP